MKGLITRLMDVSRWIDRAALVFACGGVGVMTACVLIQIVARYIFSEPPAWTEELARYAMIWAGFMGATVAYRRRLDPVLIKARSLPRQWMQAAARWIEIFAVFLFCGAVLWATPSFMALHAQRVTETLEAPSHLVVAVIPITMAILAFHAIVRALSVLMGAHEQE